MPSVNVVIRCGYRLMENDRIIVRKRIGIGSHGTNVGIIEMDL